MASKTTKATAAKAEETTGTAAVSTAALDESTTKNASVLKKTEPKIPAIRLGGRYVYVSAFCKTFEEAYRTSVDVEYNYETRMKSVRFMSDSTKIDIKLHTRERVEDYIKESFVIDTESSRADFKIKVTMENGIQVTATVDTPK